MKPLTTTLTTLEFLAVDHQADGTAAFHLRPHRPTPFRAGQHGLLVVPGGGVRPLSIASPPEQPILTFGTGLHSGSRFKRALDGLEPGAKVRLLGPLGRFTLADTEPRVVMLAQGIGITPFRSMLQHIAAAGLGTRSTLIHVGAGHPFREDTRAVATESWYPSSRDDFTALVAAAGTNEPDALFLVSGSAGFVRSTAASLQAVSVPPARIRRDAFFGYRPDSHQDRQSVADGVPHGHSTD